MKKKNKAYDMIKDAILEYKFLPGEVLQEKMLTEWLEISRTPLREALNALEKEGFIKLIPHKGAFVCDITLEEVNEILDTREILCSAAVRLATPVIPDEEIDRIYKMVEDCLHSNPIDVQTFIKIDDAFHQMFDDYCGNKTLKRMIKYISDNIKRMRIRSILTNERSVESTMEHLSILRAVKARDATMAEYFMRQHIQNAKANSIKAILTSNKGMIKQKIQLSAIK